MKNCTTNVGLDVHKKEHKVAMLLPGTDQAQEWTVKNQPREIQRMVRRVKRLAPGPIVFCYEAGVCGFALKRQIEAHGVECKVIAPSLVPIKPGQHIQTDRRDARDLAFYQRAGVLTEVHPPNEREESIRDLCRLRQATQRDLVRVRHQVSKFLLRRAMIYHQGRQWTDRHMRWLRSVRFDEPVDEEVFADYLAELDHRMEHLKILDQRVEQAAQESPYKEPVGWIRCFRGIETVTAMTIVTELHGFERFGCARELMSFVGLTPSEDSSGQRQRKGGITKAGNGRVRRVLIEASWHQRHRPATSKTLLKRRQGQPQWAIQIADRAQRRLYQRYWRLVHRGKLPTKAVTAVARELLGFLWAVLYLRGQDQAERKDAPAAKATCQTGQ